MAVILLFSHDENGSAGIILNRPTEYKVGDLGAGAASLQPELSPCTLYLGGDVGQESVHLLHGVWGLQHSAEVIPGVFLGGFEDAKRGLAEGRYKPEQFKVLTRYAGWGPGQLAAECRRGVWLCVSANKHAIFRTTLEGQLVADTTAFGRPDVAELWHYMAQLAGGDLAALSREVKGVTDPDIQRAAGGGGLGQEEAEESDQESEPRSSSGSSSAASLGGGGGGGDPSAMHRAQQARWQQQRRRTRLTESDYRDGAGI
ncbi:hypothetical protein COHA_005187 [Chlorella ohadii]|uniref:Transcriptional regulator n=1 Tax=Chlorella ohadii TaxID=2649997 RepID=A0AAD5DRM7_9CHLO|nr:hypothetical protein COHA_005187 [Chlorella ohadii]